MDLQKSFGDRYRVRLDESWNAESRENRREFLAGGEQWRYFEIRGKHGMVYPYSEDRLHVFVTATRARRLISFMNTQCVRTGICDEGITFETDLKRVGVILRLIKAERKRQYTDIQRSQMAARMTAIRLLKGQNPRQNSVPAENSASIFAASACDTLPVRDASF